MEELQRQFQQLALAVNSDIGHDRRHKPLPFRGLAHEDVGSFCPDSKTGWHCKTKTEIDGAVRLQCT